MENKYIEPTATVSLMLNASNSYFCIQKFLGAVLRDDKKISQTFDDLKMLKEFCYDCEQRERIDNVLGLLAMIMNIKEYAEDYAYFTQNRINNSIFLN